MPILDSGERREFSSGAVRDITENKGRCDLIPLDAMSLAIGLRIPSYIDEYIRSGDYEYLVSAIRIFSEEAFDSIYTAFLEVAKHYEEGAKKYSERNWEKGILLHCYIDSAVRHYLKYLRGDTDEPHARAFIWNLLGAIWTHKNLPEMRDLPFDDVEMKGL